MTMFSKTTTLAALSLLTIAALSHADTINILGRPVEGVGSSVSAVPDWPATEGDAFYSPVTGNVQYYIPLSTENGGVFGVTQVGTRKHPATAGTTSDRGDGSSSSTLSMYMRFDMPQALTGPVGLSVYFDDLDLAGANDPNGFYEAVKFYDAAGNAMTSKITDIDDHSSTGDAFAWDVLGDDDSQQIVFENIGPLINASEFYLRMDFFSRSSNYASNTPEGLSAVITGSTPNPVPEPASIALFSAGLLMIVRRRKRIRATA